MPDLSDGVNWSEVDANNNQAPPDGWPEGMMPSGVNDAARADRGAMKRFWDKINPVQTITPAGGVWTFTTGNAAYPTAYVSGEIYCFKPAGSSVGGDQFQVNGLGAKPIWKNAAPIIAQDIIGGVPAQLVYDATLNAGVGAFVLLNPQVSISGDGSGNISIPGSLTVVGPITAPAATITGGQIICGNLEVDGYSTFGTAGINCAGNVYSGGTLLSTNNRVISQGNNAPSLTMYNTTDGNAFGMWSGADNFAFGRMNNTGAPTGTWGYFSGASGDLYLNYNLHVGGTINGAIFVTLTTQLAELTTRVATLEATVADLRGRLAAHG